MSRRLARDVPATSAGVQFRAKRLNRFLKIAPDAITSPEPKNLVLEHFIFALQFMQPQND